MDEKNFNHVIRAALGCVQSAAMGHVKTLI